MRISDWSSDVCSSDLDPLPEDIVRLIIFLKVVGLSRGASGVRRDVVHALIGLLDNQVTPLVPAKGSVGASGDLAPLAHIAATLIGIGEATIAGVRMPAAEALRRETGRASCRERVCTYV